MSEIRELCRKTYRNYVDASQINSDLKKSLKTHERVPAFIDNMASEFKTQKGMKFTKEQVESAVISMTQMFISLVDKQAQERVMSPLSKGLVKFKEQEKQEFLKEAEEFDQGGKTNVIRTEQGQVVQDIHEFKT